ncbi:hypothetical protein [Alkalihalobacillus deserti]|uniref:hypothetical protein n=1 Tax=Alkalihalobacillus deserti TaxID=2879466 RepID=UPI001D14C701|nr:hypothetical protein [Alkalihalobacillus deserti]
MPRKAIPIDEKANYNETHEKENIKNEIANLSRLLSAVLNYLSDDEEEEIDIEYLFDNTEGLREWWEQYRERNRKMMEEEIKKSLSVLSLEELKNIREKINEKQ